MGPQKDAVVGLEESGVCGGMDCSILLANLFFITKQNILDQPCAKIPPTLQDYLQILDFIFQNWVVFPKGLTTTSLQNELPVPCLPMLAIGKGRQDLHPVAAKCSQVPAR